MSKYTTIQKNKLIKKLQKISVINEKNILNIKVAELKKIKETDKLTMSDIEIIWLLQEAIEEKKILNFLAEDK